MVVVVEEAVVVAVAVAARHLDEAVGARRQVDRLAVHRAEHRVREPLQVLAALAQALVKIHLSAHRRLRHRRHLVVLAGAARELVDHLLLDDGAVHVGDQQPLFPVP